MCTLMGEDINMSKFFFQCNLIFFSEPPKPGLAYSRVISQSQLLLVLAYMLISKTITAIMGNNIGLLFRERPRE